MVRIIRTLNQHPEVPRDVTHHLKILTTGWKWPTGGKFSPSPIIERFTDAWLFYRTKAAEDTKLAVEAEAEAKRIWSCKWPLCKKDAWCEKHGLKLEICEKRKQDCQELHEEKAAAISKGRPRRLVIYHSALQYTRNGFAAFPIRRSAKALNEPLKILAESITEVKKGDWQQVAALIGRTAAKLDDIIIVLPSEEDAESLRKQLCQTIFNAKLVTLAESENLHARFKDDEERITGIWKIATVACDGEYDSVFMPCWAHPRVAELMFRVCNNRATKNWTIGAAKKFQLRSNKASWEEVAAEKLDISISGPFTTHIRDILMDGVKAAGSFTAKEDLPAAEPENFFPNIWTPAQQERVQRKRENREILPAIKNSENMSSKNSIKQPKPILKKARDDPEVEVDEEEGKIFRRHRAKVVREFTALTEELVKGLLDESLKIPLQKHMEAIAEASRLLSKTIRESFDDLEEEHHHQTPEALFYSALNVARNYVDIPWIISLVYLEEGEDIEAARPSYWDKIADVKANRNFRFLEDRPLSKEERRETRRSIRKQLMREKGWEHAKANSYAVKYLLDLPKDEATQTPAAPQKQQECQTDPDLAQTEAEAAKQPEMQEEDSSGIDTLPEGVAVGDEGDDSSSEDDDSYNAQSIYKPRKDPSQFDPPAVKNPEQLKPVVEADSDEEAEEDVEDAKGKGKNKNKNENGFPAQDRQKEPEQSSFQGKAQLRRRMGRANRRSGLDEQKLQEQLKKEEEETLQRQKELEAKREQAEAQRRQQALEMRKLQEEQEIQRRQEFLKKQQEEAEKRELEKKLEAARKEKAKLEAKAAAKRQVEENTRIRQEYFEKKEQQEREAKQRQEAAQQKLQQETAKAAKAAQSDDMPLKNPRVSVFQVAETGERGNYYFLTKKQAKLMDKASVREALNYKRSYNDKLSEEERQAVKEAWYSSVSFEKFSNTRKPDHKLAKYHRASGWVIKDEPPFNASDLIRSHEIRMCHYVFEFLNYRGIKRRFKEAYEAGLIDPQRLDVLMVFTMKIVGGRLVKFIRQMFVRCFRDHDIAIPSINVEAAPETNY
ncbi:Oidioi.mRNA.OKI2018_I69.XSR.g13516.t1.cds [Oikopleura dioica]|uniref:Oidioi.mRNA.OKI2018_I69.XSR.g13516.t1.cds n=1 Tax=Oikopleura dioica TaxID=34765 RepID=A0ABN7SC87_OIKDI|nr:Oidioi.mRNA.OKI2018_I69.XSR.g13516.t1.cds [Oikopleura dioica]